MRGVGGPLLCISDLLSDVKEENYDVPQDHAASPDAAHFFKLPASDLPKLFQLIHIYLLRMPDLNNENFDELKGALEGADHSWTALTLKLCSGLEIANKLVDSTNSHVALLSEKVEELGQIIDRRDSALKAIKAIQGRLKS
ncbi:hypothetical protein OROGR_032628 [Orobanche gracilis]